MGVLRGRKGFTTFALPLRKRGRGKGIRGVSGGEKSKKKGKKSFGKDLEKRVSVARFADPKRGRGEQEEEGE